jgi:Na+-driven multidrug efflux pump
MEKIGKRDILMACGCAIIPVLSLGSSYFVFRCGLLGCAVAFFLSSFAAVLILATYIWWQSQKRREK